MPNVRYAKHTCGTKCTRTHKRKGRSIHYCKECRCYWTNGKHLPAGRHPYSDNIRRLAVRITGTLQHQQEVMKRKCGVKIPLTTLSDWNNQWRKSLVNR